MKRRLREELLLEAASGLDLAIPDIHLAVNSHAEKVFVAHPLETVLVTQRVSIRTIIVQLPIRAIRDSQSRDRGLDAIVLGIQNQQISRSWIVSDACSNTCV
jgi:hypothetical protein